MKKIAAMFLGLSMLVGTASVFADEAKDATKTKKTRAKKTGAAKKTKAKKTTEEKK